MSRTTPITLAAALLTAASLSSACSGGSGNGGGAPVDGGGGAQDSCTDPNDCRTCSGCFSTCFCATGDVQACATACGHTGSGGSGGSGAAGGSAGGAGTGGTGAAGAMGGIGGMGGTAGSGGSPVPTRAEEVCARWKADRADLAEGSWSGSVASCNAGDIGATGRQNALKLVNLYRFLHELPPVTTNASHDADAQACALMMHANGQLSHTPPMSWSCYSTGGDTAAGNSNIASTPGVEAVDLYVADPGNETTMGHRRWILSNSLGPIGLGSTTDASCMWVIGGSGNAGKPWAAWPPPGPVPIEAMTASWAGTDETGWTVQSQGIDVRGAQITVTEGGSQLPVQTAALQNGFGSRYAVRFNPQGWTSQVGRSYSVALTGIGQPINYEVEFVSCN